MLCTERRNSMKSGFNRKGVRNILIALAGLFIIFGAEDLGFFEGINRYCYDLAFRLRGTIRPGNDIVIAAIDEKTLRELGQWPLHRSRYGQLLDTLHEARAVGFTVIMAEPTADDPALAAAAARYGRTVFPLYIDQHLQITAPAPQFSRFPSGHLHIEQGIDGVTRRVFHALKVSGRLVPSFAAAIQEVAAAPHLATTDGKPSQPDNEISTDIVQLAPMHINYHGPRGTFPTIPMTDIVNGRVPDGFFKGKIVLVGPTAAGLEEQVFTPFSQQRNRMPAVEVQANILSNLLQHDNIRLGDTSVRFAACLLIAVVLFVLYMKLTETVATLVWLTASISVPVVVYLLFVRFGLWVDPAAFIFTAGFLYLLTFLFKLEIATGKLQQEYAAVADHLQASGHAAGGRGYRGLADYLSIGGINARIAILSEATCQIMEQTRQLAETNEALHLEIEQRISAQKEISALNEDLMRQKHALEAVNNELEAFSYSVSHDLRAPLRSIAGFSALLIEECLESMPPLGKEYLERINNNVVRMESLITAFLTLSRLSRIDISRQRIDIGAMAREIADELVASDRQRQVSFTITEPLFVNADPAFMRVALDNLLGNAWKFTARTAGATIEFGIAQHDTPPCYFVRDNGAGFDVTHASRLFAPFQRLHQQNEFSGTGIGLATVQRIIQRHGGTVWAEGSPGEGATFYFSLP